MNELHSRIAAGALVPFFAVVLALAPAVLAEGAQPADPFASAETSGRAPAELAVPPVRLRPCAPDRPEPVAEVAPGVMYVDLSRVDHAGFDEALPRLAEARGVVFDLRDHPGETTLEGIRTGRDEVLEEAIRRVVRDSGDRRE